MGFEALFTIVVVIISLILLVWDRFPVDMVTLGTVVALLLAGILTPDEAVAGFSNPATVTVAGMLILSAAISHSGALSALARKLAKPERKGMPINIALPLMIVVGFISAFINNTAAVAVFLPLVLEMARRAEVAPSKLLLPLSYASLFGGVCTLLGTSTNILVASLARQEGLAPFTIFEFLPVGLLFFVTGVLYMVLFGIPNLPDRGKTDLYQDYNMAGYLTELVVLADSTNAGCRLDECPLTRDLEIDILEIRREGRRLRNPGPATRILEGDVLLVRCQVDHVIELSGVEGISLKPLVGKESQADICLVEAAIAPSSQLTGKTLKEIDFRRKYGCTAIAIRHFSKILNTGLGSTPLRGGDVVLLQVPPTALERIKRATEFILLSENTVPANNRWKKFCSLAAMAVTVLLAATEVLPIVSAVLLGCLLVFATRCLDPDEAYRTVEWQVIMLLGGMLALGEALEKTGITQMMAQQVTKLGELWGPVALVSGLYLLTSLLTEVISNNAAAVLLVPVAIGAAEGLGVDPKPLVMAICFAASASFMTPIGYQTNTLVFGPGRYKFKDYLKVGTPLNILFWIIATFAIPVFWPL